MGTGGAALRVAVPEHVAPYEIGAYPPLRWPHRVARLPRDEPQISGDARSQRRWPRHRQAAHGQRRQGRLSAVDRRDRADDGHRLRAAVEKQPSAAHSRIANERRRPNLVAARANRSAEPRRSDRPSATTTRAFFSPSTTIPNSKATSRSPSRIWTEQDCSGSERSSA